MFLSAKDIVEVKKEDNKIYIRLDQFKISDLIRIFVESNDLKYVNLAFHIDREKAKEKIEDDILYELRKGNIKFYIDYYEIFQKYGVDVKKIIKEYINSTSSLPARNIYEVVLNNFINESKGKTLVKDFIKRFDVFWNNVDDIILLSKLYKEYVKENVKIFILNEEFFGNLKYYYHYFKFGRGSKFEYFIKMIIFVEKLYENDLLDKSILDKIRDFLIVRKEDLRRIIKRRIEKENHKEYIKHLLKLLKLVDEDIEKEFLVYFL